MSGWRRGLKSILLARPSYVPGGNRKNRNNPFSSELTDIVSVPSDLARRTLTAGRVAPEGSSVTPVSAPVEAVWLYMFLEDSSAIARIAKSRDKKRQSGSPLSKPSLVSDLTWCVYDRRVRSKWLALLLLEPWPGSRTQ